MWNWFETRWRVEGEGPPGGVGRAHGAWRKLLGRAERKLRNVIGRWKERDTCYVVVEGSGALLPAENRKHP